LWNSSNADNKIIMINRIKIICSIFLSAILFALPVWSQKISGKISAVPYTWKNVQIAGGGFVDGIIFHPKAKGVRYCRTDMGGAYSWNDATKRWEPLLDFISYEDLNLMGIESIAVDPSDANFVILACGTYTNPRTGNGAILRSFDRGKTFQRTNVPFKFGGNENGRGNGERMSVDPNNGNIIYLGTRLNGVWKSIDKGKTWEQVKTFPDMTEALPSTTGLDSVQQRRAQFQNRGSGVVVTLFDPRSGVAPKGSSTIYIAASLMGRDNIFKSKDGGISWQPVAGQPVQYRPTHAILSSDGMLYITYGDNPGPSGMTNGAVWKYNTGNGQWTDITPDKPSAAENRKFGYAAVSTDAYHPQTIIVSTYNRYSAGGEEIFRSLDGGNTWKPVFKTGKIFNNAAAPYVERTGIHWLFDIEIDPFDSNHAMFTTGYGGHETFNLTDIDKNKPATWTVMSAGIEETVALELASPPKGANLLTAIGDYGGFVHWDLDKPAKEGNYSNPHFNNTDGVVFAENNPDVIVRVGIASHPAAEKNIGYSMDAGKSWQPAATMPKVNSQRGSVAVSADGKTWIWTPQRSAVYITHDTGATWQQATGIPDNSRVIADKVNSDKFYALALLEGKLYISNDGGNIFTPQTLPATIQIPKERGNRGDDRGGQDRIYAAPGREGDLWIPAFDGLYHSTDEGKIFLRMNDVTEIHGFGFGKAAPGFQYPSLYLTGIVNGVRGMFRSDDMAQKWVRINDDMHQWGLVLHITGDPKKYGRVYVGTHGRGIFYGDPSK
jgi:photosystem II stability/assembly factor-like uncharacterized protein